MIESPSQKPAQLMEMGLCRPHPTIHQVPSQSSQPSFHLLRPPPEAQTKHAQDMASPKATSTSKPSQSLPSWTGPPIQPCSLLVSSLRAACGLDRLSRKVLRKLQSTALWVPEGHVFKDAVNKVRRKAPASVP